MLLGIITQGPAFSHRGAQVNLQNRIIFAQVAKREVVCESTLSCFPTSIKFTLMSLKNTICLDDRLSQGWDIGYCCEMRAFGILLSHWHHLSLFLR